jgi:hypothetical protein
MRNRFFLLTIVLVFIAWAGGLIWNFNNFGFIENGLPVKQDILLGLTAFTLSVTTYLGIISLHTKDTEDIKPPNHEILRTAITGCILITYLFILCYYMFLRSDIVIGTVTDTLLNSLTNLVGVTIAFYFGTSAAVQIFAKKDNEKEVEKKKNN